MTLKRYCKKGQWRTNHQNHYINAIIFQASPATSRRGSVNEPSSRSEGKVTVPDQSQQASSKSERTQTLFTEKTQCIVWGMQQRAVQGMLDFDYVCSRREPSVVAMIYPFTWVTFFLFFVFLVHLNLVMEKFYEKIISLIKLVIQLISYMMTSIITTFTIRSHVIGKISTSWLVICSMSWNFRFVHFYLYFWNDCTCIPFILYIFVKHVY